MPAFKPSLILKILLLGLFISPTVFAIEYQITFEGTWNEADVDPGNFPSFSAHFTELIGTTHVTGQAFWRTGEAASESVELVAELGSNGRLLNDISQARSNGLAGETIQFKQLFNLPNSDTIVIDVDADKPFITLISMIAPSPDWFVGVSELPLQQDGEWKRQFSVNLRPYDAGTEEGEFFTLTNSESPPGGIITRLSGDDSPFIGRPVIGRLSFKLLSDPNRGSTNSESNTVKVISAVNSLLLED